MTPIAQARIVVWEGGALWVVDSTQLAASGLRATGFHAHHAIQVVIDLGGRFRLSTREAEATAGDVAVAADTPHRFEAEGRFGLLFVEPESRAGRIIVTRLLGDGALGPAPAGLIDDFRERIAEAYLGGKGGRARLVQAGRDLVDRLAGDSRPEVLDPRVRRVLAWAAQRGEASTGLAAAAPVAGLSPERLRHLFVAQTGLSLRTYLLWVRLTRAVTLMGEGAALTQAAHEAGFADSAHFSRTFRRMFGVAANSLAIS